MCLLKRSHCFKYSRHKPIKEKQDHYSPGTYSLRLGQEEEESINQLDSSMICEINSLTLQSKSIKIAEVAISFPLSHAM